MIFLVGGILSDTDTISLWQEPETIEKTSSKVSIESDSTDSTDRIAARPRRRWRVQRSGGDDREEELEGVEQVRQLGEHLSPTDDDAGHPSGSRRI